MSLCCLGKDLSSTDHTQLFGLEFLFTRGHQNKPPDHSWGHSKCCTAPTPFPQKQGTVAQKAADAICRMIFKHRPKLEWGLGSHFCRSLSGIYTTANYTEVLFYTSQLAVPITRFYQKVRKASYKHRCAFIAMLSMTHSYLWNLTQDPSKILWLYGIIYSELDVLDLSKSKISWIAF